MARRGASGDTSGMEAAALDLLLISNSVGSDGAFLAHARDAIAEQLGTRGVRRALFIPYAAVLPSYDEATARARTFFAALGVTLASHHEGARVDPDTAIVVG